MITKLLTKVIGSRNDRTLRRLRKIVKEINNYEPEFETLSDEELKAKTVEFRERLEKGDSLDSLLPEAFATVREASKRVFGMRHFDVQLIGGMVLNNGQIAEMRTGEGKTLTATLPAYLNALPSKGVHIVTVNDYLASRDAETNRPLFEFLGMTVGVNVPNMPPLAKKKPIKRIFFTERITSLVSITYATTWLSEMKTVCSESVSLQLSMRWIPFLLMKRVPHLSSLVLLKIAQIFTLVLTL